MKEEKLAKYSVAIAGIKRYESLTTNTKVSIADFERLKAKKDTVELSRKQQDDYDKYVTRMAYSPGVDIRNADNGLVHQHEQGVNL